ncbi:hypothetical protein Ahy_B08g089985 [Arachis hypogaea]|uniref:Uncharacterized protein n=1 Tax=Arachis hypogaea TaxID=3818 RepID=A0A444XZD1_ARAHY|nr:hypothetical protein Ahy_B08g089985 [Arachis hypogaea]
MERSEIIKRCVYFYEEMRSKHEDLMLFFVLMLFVYFRDRTSGQLSLGGRMNSRIRREALERIVGEGDRNCIWELRMNTNAFANLCELLEVQGGLKFAHPTKFYSPGKPFPLFHQLDGIFGRDRATGAAAISSFNAEEQVNEETEDTAIGFDDSEMSPQPELDGGPAMQGQASHSEAGASVGSTRRYGRKRKQADILERMADHIQQSSADQRKNAQLIVDAIVGVNEKFKVGEKLTQLGFGDDEVVRAILKFSDSPNVYAHFWGLIDSQMIGLVCSII